MCFVAHVVGVEDVHVSKCENVHTEVVPQKNQYLEPQTTIYKLMFGETTIFYIKIWNHPIETSIYKWLFGVPGSYEWSEITPIGRVK